MEPRRERGSGHLSMAGTGMEGVGGGGQGLHQRLTHKVLRFPFFLDEYDSNDGACWKKPSTEKRSEAVARQRAPLTHTLWVARLHTASNTCSACSAETFRACSPSASATPSGRGDLQEPSVGVLISQGPGPRGPSARRNLHV